MSVQVEARKSRSRNVGTRKLLDRAVSGVVRSISRGAKNFIQKPVADLPNQNVDSLEPRIMFATQLHCNLYNPSSTRVYSDSINDEISTTGEVDEYRVTITGGQQLSAIASPVLGTTLTPRIKILSDDGTTTYVNNVAGAAGQSVIAQPVNLPAGSYLIRIEGGSTETGKYRLSAFLNTGFENEPVGGSTNDTIGTATNANTPNVVLQGSGRLTNIHGRTDGLGKSDLYRVDLSGGQAMSALLSNPSQGFGQFNFENVTQTLPVINAMKSGDFNSDGIPDIVIAGEGNFFGPKLQILISDGQGGYSDTINWGGATTIDDIAVADFDKDGHLDVAAISADMSSGRYEPYNDHSRLTIFYGDGTGHVASTNDHFYGTSYSMTTGDFNGDSNVDIALGVFPWNSATGKIVILLNDGSGDVSAPIEITTSGRVYDIEAADLNHDGIDDIITGEGSLAAIATRNSAAAAQDHGWIGKYFLTSTGELDHTSMEDHNRPVVQVAVGDINNDTNQDIIAVELNTSDETVLIQDHDGNVSFGYGFNITNNLMGPRANIELADVNRDGYLDQITSIGDDSVDRVYINLNSRDNFVFGGGGEFDHPTQVGAFTLADVNLDGDLDLITGSTERKNDGSDDYSEIATRIGRGEVQLALLDAAGNQVLLSNSGGYFADQGLLDFYATTGGTYYVRVTGDLGAEYQMGITAGAKFGVSPSVVDNRTQDITKAGQVAGHFFTFLGTDSYTVNIQSGDSITANIIARGYGPGDPNNTLVPSIVLRDSGGTIVASDLNAGNFQTASFNYTATLSGKYTVEVTANSGEGDYDLLVTGPNGPAPSFAVSNVNPSGSEVINYRPWIFVDFNQPLFLPSVQASDLTVNGQPATAFGTVDGDTIYFQTDSLFQDDGTYNLSIAAGSILSSLGAPIAAKNWSIAMDHNGPRVLTSSITNNQTLQPGANTWSVSFSEPLRTFVSFGIFGQLILDSSDVRTVNQTTGQSVALSQMVHTAPPPNVGGDPTALDLVFNNLSEGLYESRLYSAYDGFASQFADSTFQNNPLDGENNGTLPSGDGNPGGDYVVQYIVDAAGVTPLTTLTARSPLGSEVHEASTVRAFHATGDVDSFSVNLDPNQQITIMLVPNAGSAATAKLELKDPNGNSLGTSTGGPGDAVVLQSINGTVGGNYRIDASSLDGTAGYTLRVIINAAAENEATGQENNSRASAQSLNMRTLAVGANGVRGAVLGTADGTTDDYYKLDLTAGQPASFAASGIDGGVVNIRLEDASGNIITNGAAGQYNADRTMIDYVPSVSGTFYVAVSGTGRYNLLATRAASFECETTNQASNPQDLSISKQVLGHLKGGVATGGQINVLEIGADFYGVGINADRMITQLNDDTYYNFNAVRTTATGADTLAELSPYDVVVLASNANITAAPGIGAALKQYIELGGAVVTVGSGAVLLGNNNLAAVRSDMPADLLGGFNFGNQIFNPVGTHPITNLIQPGTNVPLSQAKTNGALFGNATTIGTDSVGNPTLIVRDSIGFGGRSMFLGYDFAEVFSNDPNVRGGDGDRLLEQALAWAAQAGDQADTYTIVANSGDQLTITTSLPMSETALPVNLLDPIIDLYSPSGTLITSNDNGLDGVNARINYTVPNGQAGIYKVVVRAASFPGGTYTLQATGATGSVVVNGPTVIATTPTVGQKFANPPTTIDVTLSETISGSSVSTGDLVLSSGTVTGATLLDGNTVRFTVNIPNVDSTLSYTIPAGAFTDLQGDVSAAYSSNFIVDKRGPHVVSSTPATQASAPFNTWVFTFDEPITTTTFSAAAIDSFTGPGGVNLSSSIFGAVINGNTLTITFSPRTAAGDYTMTLKPTIITDLVGNKMDQDQDGNNGETTEDKYSSTITLASPNLLVDNVQVLTPAVYGSPVTVQWTVRNNGTDPAADGWSDRVYLSADSTVDGGDLVLLTIGSPTVPLAPGQTYTRTATINLPLNTTVTPGTYRFIVRTDRSFNQSESNENDNDTPSAATTVSLPALPDLAVSNVQLVAPVNPVSGGQATLQWTLTNTGTAAVSGVIRDNIWISPDNQVGGDTDLGGVDYSVNLAPGQSVTRTVPINIPINQFGSKYFIVKTDYFNSVFEHTNEANNTAVSGPVSISLSPVPDLVVTSITTPASVTSGTTQTVTWTLANQGTADWNGTINENIFLSDDNAIGGDVYYKTVTFTGSIPAGQSITRSTTIDIPIQTSGAKYAIVQTDASDQVFENNGESNNTTIDDNSMTVVLPPTPDLIVTSITAPATSLSGRSIPISWTIKNNGVAAMNGSFVSNVYLSPDDSIGNDQLFDQFTFTGTIAPGQTITQTNNINLPNVYAGNYKIVVAADAGNSIFENTFENNNTSIDDNAIAISQSPYPNLQVTSTTVPPTAQSQESVQVSWVVTNNGDASTNAAEWYDQVYLSANPTFDSTDVLVAQVRNASYLNSTESYSQTANITIPQGVQGTYYFIVKTDAFNQVYEYQPSTNAEADNERVSSPSTITLSPPPDLMVTSIARPVVAFSGQPSTVSWTVTNNGTGPTRSNETSWSDTVWISTTTSIDGNAKLLGTFSHFGGLAVGASYTNSQQVTLPIGISGNYYFIVRTDTNSNVYEDAFESNNDTAAPATNILLTPPPDLHVTSITAPATSTSGRSISVNYTVTNEGLQTTPNSNWTDRIYLSPTATFDGNTAIFLADRGRSGALPAGQSYSATVTGTIPLNVTGTYYVFVATDLTNDVFELDNANNIVGSINPVTISQSFADLQMSSFTPPASLAAGTLANFSFTVTNAGTGDSITNFWRDQIILSSDNVMGNGDDILIANQNHNGVLAAGASYTVNSSYAIPPYVATGTYNLFYATDVYNEVSESNDANNNNSLTPLTISVTQNTPDLQVINTTAPGAATSGQPVAVSFTVKNLGSAATVANAWVDQVFISTDTVIDNEDRLLGQILHSNSLGVNGEYTVNTSVVIPVDYTGVYYLIARTDRDNVVVEGTLDNNNDRTSSPINVGLQTLPDLSAAITAPANANSGQVISFNYTVTNLGSDIPASNYWYDTVYLSQDTSLDRHDIALGTYLQQGPLTGGTNYAHTQSVKLPAGLSGEYYLILAADNSDRIYERGSELNNVKASSAMQINLLPPADLVAGTIVLPVNGTPGQNAAITYTVSNNSTQPAIGRWTDSLYVSKDQTWDINDPLFSRFDHIGDVPASGSYTHTVTAPLPGVTPGNYYLIVRSDILNSVPESIETNNLAASVDSMVLDVPALVLGTASNGTLSQGKSAYYRIDVPEGETLFVDLDAAATTGSTQLFVKYAGVPTRADFDYGYKDALSTDQRITVPKTKAGTYYILAYGDSLSAATNFNITARLLNFEITDTTYGVGGNGGKLTLQINGAKFDRSITPKLVSPGGGEREAEQVLYVDSTRLYATFDLNGLTPNAYDVKLSKATGSVAIVNDALQVIAGTNGQAKPTIFAPSITLANALFEFTVAWGNDGINDVPSPYLVVTSDRLIGQNPSFIDVKSYTFLGSGQDDGPGGVLRPDQIVHRVFYSKNGPKGSGINIYADRLGSDPSKLFDWSHLHDVMKEEGFTDEEFEPAFAKMIADIGPTWGDFLRAVSEGASKIEFVNSHDQLPSVILPYQLHTAAAEISTSIRGKIYAPDMDVPIYEQIVTAHNKTNDKYYSTQSYIDGSYIFDYLTPGDYEIYTDAGITQPGNTLTLAANQHVTGSVINVEKGSSLSGFVHGPDGSASAGASVSIYDSVNQKVRSIAVDDDGSYTISGITPGTYTLFADAPGQARGIAENVVVGSQADVVQNFNLVAQSKIVGSVQFGIGSSTPINISIQKLPIPSGRANSYDAVVNGNLFEIAGVAAGQYELSIQRNGYATVTQTINLAAGQTLNLGTVNVAAAAVIGGQISSTTSKFVVGDNMVGLYQGATFIQGVQASRTGAYSFDDVAAGTYTIKVSTAEGLFADTPSVTVIAGQTSANNNIAVHPGGSITGTVTRQSNGATMSGMLVKLLTPDGKTMSAISDEGGVYRFTGLNLGTYTVSSITTSTSATVTSLEANPAVDANLSVQIGATISGTLLDSGGNPIVGAVNLMQNGNVIGIFPADSTGHYLILVNQPGTYDLAPQSLVGAFTAVQNVVVNTGADLTQNFAAGTGSLHVTLPSGSNSNLLVTLDHVTSAGLVDAGLAMDPATSTLDFTDLVPGDYRLRVRGPNNTGSYSTITVGTGATNVSVTLSTEAKLTGMVTTSGNPVSNVGLRLVSTTQSFQFATLSEQNGTYTVQNILPGTYDLIISANGYETIIQSGIVIAAGATVTMPVLLTVSTATVTGRVVDSSGNPIANSRVTIMSADGTKQLGSVMVNPNGTFSYTGASGSNLKVYYNVGGSLPTVVSNVTITPVSTTALGDLTAVPTSYLTGSPQLNGTSNRGDGVIPIGNVRSPDKGTNSGKVTSDLVFPGWGDFVKASLDTWGRVGGEAYISDLYPLDNCGKCIDTLREAVRRIKIQELNFSAGSSYVNAMRTNLRHAVYAFAKDLDVICIVIPTAILAAKALAAGVLAAQTLTAMGGLGTAIQAAPGAWYTIGYAAASIINGINSFYQAVIQFGAQPQPKGALEQVEAGGNILTVVSSTLANVIALISEELRNSSPGFGASGGALDLLNIAVNLRSIIASFQLKDMNDILKEVIQMNDQLDQVKINYRKNVVAAAKAAAKHKACYFSAKDDCDGTVDIPDDILDTLKFIGALNSLDPNDITGPVGYGPENFVKSTDTQNYTIRYENSPAATAPAHKVVITQNLDTDLDIRTFRLGNFGFGGSFFDVPSDSAFYQTRLDLRESRGIYLDVVAGIDVINRQAFWQFISIDPATGDESTSPLLGFLPPDITSPEGEGFVNYTINPLVGLSTGTVINSLATIVFDQEAPLDTPSILNTLDAAAPASSVTALPPINPNGSDITVNWEGADETNGSAIATFNVYVAVDGGPFQLWIDKTDLRQAVYAGQQGHSYAFYTVSVDNADNIESAPLVADATTSITSTNHAPAVDVGAATGASDEGSIFTRTGLATDEDAGDVISATVDYGDGAGVVPLTLALDGSFSLSHTYTDNGLRTITVRVTDSSNATTEKTIDVTVNNVAPVISPITNVTIPYDGTGGDLLVGGSFLDPGADTFTGQVDYGSGFVPLTLNANGTFSLSNRYTTPGLYTVVVKVTDDDASEGTQTFQVRLLPPKPTVTGLTVNDGNIQRSMITSLTLTFDQAVTVPPSAISLNLRTPTGPQPVAATLSVAPVGIDGKVWKITYSGAGLEGGSLADGVYDLSVNGTLVTDAFGQSMASSPSMSFHRLFGDSDGDRDADAVDQTRIRAVLNKPANYIWYFDNDNNGTVDNNDFVAARLRFNKVLFS